MLIQVLVLSDIHLFNIITPMPFVYVTIIQSRDFPRWGTLLMSFLLGLGIDMFCNTPGVTTASLTAVAFLQPYYLEAFTSRDTPADFSPSLGSMQKLSFITYSLPLVFLFFILEFMLEAFSFQSFMMWFEGCLGSFAVTYLFVIAMEIYRRTM